MCSLGGNYGFSCQSPTVNALFQHLHWANVLLDHVTCYWFGVIGQEEIDSIDMLLKDKSGVGVIGDKIQDTTAMNGVSYFFSLFFIMSL